MWRGGSGKVYKKNPLFRLLASLDQHQQRSSVTLPPLIAPTPQQETNLASNGS